MSLESDLEVFYQQIEKQIGFSFSVECRRWLLQEAQNDQKIKGEDMLLTGLSVELSSHYTKPLFRFFWSKREQEAESGTSKD